jgi:hypothetical protein
MAAISVGELLVRCLKAEGVESMAGIIDGAHTSTPKVGIWNADSCRRFIT